LGDPDLAEIGVLDEEGLSMEDGIQLSLVDIDIDPVWLTEFVEVVFSKLPHIDDHPGVRGMGVRTEVIDLNSRILTTSQQRNTKEDKNKN